MPSSITYTAVLDVSRATAEHLARLLQEHRERVGTRKATRALGAFRQAVLVLRWFIDGTRMSQLARDNAISLPTSYRYLHEGLTVLADHAPDLSTALERAAAVGYTHLNLDGTVIRTDRVAAPGPNGADLWWSGKHKHHGGNVQVVSAPDGWPLWVSPVRPGREHDTTCARTHGLIDALNRLATALDMPTLTDLGYENAGPGFRHPVKKPQGGELAEHQQAFNKVIRSIHGVAERANALLKVTFKALRRVSLDPAAITRIARAALALLQIEHGRTTRTKITNRHQTLPRRVHYAERLVFTNGREGRTRVYLGRAVRDRIDQMTYTDYGEDWAYTSVAQDPDTGVVTGVTTTSPDKYAHHTATWVAISTAERDAFLQAQEEKWREFWRVVASVGA